METKPKLMINRSILVSEKSPPPTKLLINHGKPNFTIVKSPKTKSPPAFEENIFSGTDLKPSALRKKSPPKGIQSNGSVNGVKTSDEFLRLHKKIGGRNFDDIDNNNCIGIYQNGHATVGVVKENSPAEQHFATLERTCIYTLNHPNETVAYSNGIDNNNQINGIYPKSPALEKPATPEKPDLLKPFSSSSNSSRTTSPQPKQGSLADNSTESVNSSCGVNFEQKTVVSFSRDLSVTPNRYPDTVKTTMSVDQNGGLKTLPKEFAGLKFEIVSGGELVRPMKKNAA